MSDNGLPFRPCRYPVRLTIKVAREVEQALLAEALARGMTPNDLHREILGKALECSQGARITSGMKKRETVR